MKKRALLREDNRCFWKKIHALLCEEGVNATFFGNTKRFAQIDEVIER